MRTREKIMVLLVAISVVLGSIIFINFSGNELEANYFRWLFFNNLRYGAASPGQFINDELPAGTLVYGILALFAVVVMIVVLKMLRDGELQSLRTRLTDVGAAKVRAESLLQEEVWKGKTERQAKDSVTRDLETSIDRIENLIVELNQKEQLVKVRENELVSLKARVVEQSDNDIFLSPSSRGLRAELEKARASLQAKDELVGDLENRLTAKTQLWESQLREKETLVKARDGELAGLRTELKSLSERIGEVESARKRAESRWQDELREKKKVIEANELRSRNEEQRLGEKIRALELQVGDKDKLLRGREAELMTVRRQLNELASTNEVLESRLQEELGNAEKDRRAIDALVKEAEQKYAETIRGLQDELGERDSLLQARDDELRTFKNELRSMHSKVSELTASKERLEASLQQELRKEQERRREIDVAHKQLEERFAKELDGLRGSITEKEQILKSRDGEIKLLAAQVASLQDQVHKAEGAKERAAAALQEQQHKEQEQRRASDNAMQALEDSFRAKISALEKQLSEKLDTAASTDTAELGQLRAELQAASQRMSELTAAKEKAEGLFRAALQDKTEALQSNERARKDQQDDFADKLKTMESRLHESAELAQNRETELLSVKKELAALNASKDQEIRSLQTAVRQHAELVQAKESDAQALDNRSSEIIRSLESQIMERDEILASRDAELRAIGGKVSKLTAQLAEFGRAKDQDARLLREELRQKTDLLRVKDSAIKKIEERFNNQVNALEKQLGERAEQLENRDSEIDGLMAKVSALAQERAALVSERDKSDRLIQDELREKTALLQAKESSMGEVEEQLTAKVQSLEHQLAERQKLLESSGAELGELRSQIYLLTERMGEVEGAKFRAETQLQEERKRASQTASSTETQSATGREFNGDAYALDDLLNERDQLLKARDKLIQELMVELKEKKSQLAKHEIEVWQNIERRDAWKHRLSKFGIRLKD